MIVSRLRGRSVLSCTLNLNGQTLDRVHQYKYLGVILTDGLTWSTHISEISNKARKITRLIYPQFYNMSSTSSLLQLYSSLVRLHLEYASQVWDLFLIKDIRMLESVQKFALKVCCKNWDSSYDDNLQQSLLPELSACRKYLNLSYFYNLVNRRFEFPDTPATLRQSAYNTRSSTWAVQVFMSNLLLILIFFCILSSPRPSHYGTLFHTMSCFPLLFHLLRNLCSHLY